MYAAKLRGDQTSVLFISDGTMFSAGLARTADSAGFRVVSAPGRLMARLTEDVCEYDVLSVPVLIILVRGEHYSDYGHDDFYSRLRKYVTSGGHLFVTSWTAWENRNDGPLLAVLPFNHVQESYHEDEMVRAAAALRMGANSLCRAKGYFGEFFRRMRAKLGIAQAITATAHKIARILYHILSTKESYAETVFHRCDEQAQQRAEMRLRKQAARLGFQLLPIPIIGE